MLLFDWNLKDTGRYISRTAHQEVLVARWNIGCAVPALLLPSIDRPDYTDADMACSRLAASSAAVVGGVAAGVVFGGYTVNLMRSRMEPQERQAHDTAWGLNFGDPSKVRVTPEPGVGDTQEHPMSVNMAPSLKEELAKNPSLISSTDDRGWTLLHQEALAGSAPTVRVLLEAGADPTLRTNDGKTPLQLAQSLSWDNVVALLTHK